MKTKYIPSLLLGFFLVGCQSGGSADQASVELKPSLPDSPQTVQPIASPQASPIAAPSVTPATTPSATPQAISVTVYTASKSEAPVNGWVTKVYTAQGRCTIYQSRTYCWDDGLKVLAWNDLHGNHFGPYGYTYFGVGTIAVNQTTFNGHGALISDLMTAPTLIHQGLETSMLIPSATVLATGAQTTETCTENGGTLTCTNFSIDLNQAPL